MTISQVYFQHKPEPHPLRALVETMLSGIETLEAAHATYGVPYPSLDDPHRIPTPLDDDVHVIAATNLIVAASAQILATARKPIETLQNHALSMYMTTSLGFVIEANIADILKDAGQGGLHTTEISAANGVDPVAISRVLRHLAAHHIFKEVSPNVFANNQISSLLAKAKSLEEIKADPGTQFEGAGSVAWIAHAADVSLKSSTAVATFLLDPQGHNTPFNIAMNETSTVWEWFERPENSMRRNRFTEAMRGATAHYPPELYTSAIDWDSLESGAMVVDVGGGVGNVTWILAQEFSHLLYVVQDMDKVIPEANKFWRATSPESISSGQIEIQAHDFLKPQPIKDAAVYFMRFIIHDWHDVEAIKIMKNLRDAAGPSSQLILFDIVLPNACRRKSSEHTLIGSGKRKSTSMSPPVSMLPPGIDWATSVDMQMLNLFNAQERTLEEFVALGKASRWKFQVMKPGKPLSAIIFSPA